jgi:glycosyltransferase involved in cell wall biosynthesis
MVSAIIPAFNESRRISGVVKGACAYADEVLVVETGVPMILPC